MCFQSCLSHRTCLLTKIYNRIPHSSLFTLSITVAIVDLSASSPVLTHSCKSFLFFGIVLTRPNLSVSEWVLIHLRDSGNIKEVVHHLMLPHIGFPVIA